MALYSALPLPPSLQKMTPDQARFCIGLFRFLQHGLVADLSEKKLLIGFSGGADSTSLLLAMHALCPKMNTSLVAAHLDHGLRPGSGEEAEQCRAFCASLSIPFLAKQCDVAGNSQTSGCGVEEAARDARYAFFAEAAKESQCDWILTAHTANDLAEDILMRLIRGAGWPALSGMAGIDGRRRLLRPLLQTPRKDIETFLRSLGVSWIEDESNQDPKYFRNRVRSTILPLFLEENPSFLDAATGLWKLGRIDGEWIDSLLHESVESAELLSSETSKEASEQNEQRVPSFLSAGLLHKTPKALRLRLYKQILSNLGPGQARLDSLLALDASWVAARGRGGLDSPGKGGSGEEKEHRFAGGKCAVVSKKGIRFACRRLSLF